MFVWKKELLREVKELDAKEEMRALFVEEKSKWELSGGDLQ